jgi:16S rRNA (cytosine1402-N4)-methyltransferase
MARKKRPIRTTQELTAILEPVLRKGKIHFATKVFQALRIAVNDELVSLEIALPQALELLETNGRIVVISFHSLEDRVVKHTFIDWEEKGLGKIITKKPIEPTEEEIEGNRRSRSSKLRIFESFDFAQDK